MDFFVEIISLNQNNCPDTFLIRRKNTDNDKFICVETDLFKLYNKDYLIFNCREINLEENDEILNIKYLKTFFRTDLP
jgi:hypothetical protein